jgi:phosphatidylglycerol lysyltransferase
VTSKTTNRLMLVATLAMFLAAMFVLYHQLGTTRLSDVLDRLGSMPMGALMGAVLLTVASYLVLTGYDFLALRYTRRKLRPGEVMFASFTAFAFSNSIGFALVSGGSVRYRIYSALGLRAVEIGEIVVFCTLSYALGVCMAAGLMLVLDPVAMAGVLRVPPALASLAGAVLVAIPTAYLAATLIRRRPIRLHRYHLRLPTFGIGVAQIVLASIDQLLAGAVVYVLLAPGQDLSFGAFLGVYLVAAPASVLSLVPGGLGVLETLIVLLLPQAPRGALLGALVAYRFIYFLLPLALAVTWVTLLQVARVPSDLGWLARAVGAVHARLTGGRHQKRRRDKPAAAAKALSEAPR